MALSTSVTRVGKLYSEQDLTVVVAHGWFKMHGYCQDSGQFSGIVKAGASALPSTHVIFRITTKFVVPCHPAVVTNLPNILLTLSQTCGLKLVTSECNDVFIYYEFIPAAKSSLEFLSFKSFST